MKKHPLSTVAITVLLALGLFTAVNAQAREKIQFGPKAGMNYSNVYDTQGEAFEAEPKFGFVAGLFLSIPIGAYLGIQPEVLYSQKGFQATGKLLGSAYRLTRTTHFIDVPILVAFKPMEALTLLIGPQYSYLTRQTDEFSNSAVNLLQEEVFSNDNLRKNLFCFLGGFDANMSGLVLGPRVGWDVTNNNGDGTSTTPRYKNVWYQLTLGVRL